MPRAAPDTELLTRVLSLIEACSGNQSEAARRMGMSRLDVNRLLAQEGRVTMPKRQRLWKGIERATAARVEDLQPVKTLQSIQDVPVIALQVLQYMTEAVEERQGRGSAANDR
jgi:hypothetical protein